MFGPNQRNLTEERRWKLPTDVNLDFDLVHPRVFYTPENLERARRNITEGNSGADHIYKQIIKEVESSPWWQMSDAQIRELVPDPYSHFVDYHGLGRLGTNQCPVDGTKLELIGLEDPVKVKCDKGHIFPIDNGEGWETSDGSIYTYLACWNSFVIRGLRDVLEPLGYAYALSDETEYAHRAAIILDAFATIYPTTTVGPLDRPRTKLGKENGRFDRAIYEIGRPLVKYVSTYDLILSSGELDSPSPTNPGLTIKENVAINLLVNGADACYRFLHTNGCPGFMEHPHNGTLDEVRALVAVGSLFNIQSYLQWARDGPLAIDSVLANTLDRDGNFYETSPTYNEYTKKVLMNIADVFYNLYKLGNEEGLNLFDSDHFAEFFIPSSYRNNIAGRLPHYGDVQRVRTKLGGEGSDVHTAEDEASDPYYTGSEQELWDIDLQEHDYKPDDEVYHTLKFCLRTEDTENTQRYASHLADLTDGSLEPYLKNVWTLFNLDSESREELNLPERSPSYEQYRGSEVLTGKGVAMLRPDESDNRGVLFRYGPTYRHGHMDELGLNIYAADRELSFDPGYNMGHYRVGWCHQTVSHHTVSVNEASQRIGKSVGGNLNFFGTGDGFSIVDASDEQIYENEGVDTYRRTVAYVDSSPTESYLVDIFRIAGGDTRDYSFHGLGVDFQLENVELTQPEVGSLGDSEYWWGDQLDAGDSIETHSDKEFYWNPPPENGYGFLGNPQRGAGDDVWSATWSLDRGTSSEISLVMLPEEDRELIVADAPTKMNEMLGIEDDHVKYVLARDTGPEPSQYVSVIDPNGGKSQVDAIAELEVTRSQDDDESFSPVALEVSLAEHSIRDYFLSTLSDKTFTATSNTQSTTTDGEFAMVREDSEGIRQMRLQSGTSLACNEIELAVDSGEITGQVVSVDQETNSIVIDSQLPLDRHLQGHYIHFDSATYSHNTSYRIHRVAEEEDSYRVFLDRSPLLAKGRIDDEPHGDVLPNEYKLPAANQYLNHTARNQRSSGMNDFFDGKQVESEDGESTVITTVTENYGLEVTNGDGFKQDDELFIYDIKEGDSITIPIFIDINRRDLGTYEIETPVPLSITPPGTGSEETSVQAIQGSIVGQALKENGRKEVRVTPPTGGDESILLTVD